MSKCDDCKKSKKGKAIESAIIFNSAGLFKKMGVYAADKDGLRNYCILQLRHRITG